MSKSKLTKNQIAAEVSLSLAMIFLALCTISTSRFMWLIGCYVCLGLLLIWILVRVENESDLPGLH